MVILRCYVRFPGRGGFQFLLQNPGHAFGEDCVAGRGTTVLSSDLSLQGVYSLGPVMAALMVNIWITLNQPSTNDHYFWEWHNLWTPLAVSTITKLTQWHKYGVVHTWKTPQKMLLLQLVLLLRMCSCSEVGVGIAADHDVVRSCYLSWLLGRSCYVILRYSIKMMLIWLFLVAADLVVMLDYAVVLQCLLLLLLFFLFFCYWMFFWSMVWAAMSCFPTRCVWLCTVYVRIGTFPS